MKTKIAAAMALAFVLLLASCGISDTPPAETVSIGGTGYTADTSSIKLQDSGSLDELISSCGFFTYLKSIDINSAGLSGDEILRLEDAFPASYIDYSVSFLGRDYDGHSKELDLSASKPSEVLAERDTLSKFVYLKNINILRPDGTSAFGLDDYIALRKAAPSAAIDYSFDLFGQEVSVADTEELRYVKQDIGDEGLGVFKKVLPYLDALKYLSLDTCGTTDERMAELRDDFPDVKIVWRVFFGTDLGQSCMTDTEKIWAIGCLGTDPLDTAGLYYCTDVKIMDIGHNSVTNIDFLYNMPDMEVLIIACGEFNDVTAVGSLKNLEYLEVGETHVKDLTPLVNCENLEHLHVGGSYELTDEDVMPLLQLKHLKRLNCANMSSPEFHTDKMRKLFHEAMPDTKLIFGYIYGSSFWGEWRYGDGPNGYDERYALLREQVGYEGFNMMWMFG